MDNDDVRARPADRAQGVRRVDSHPGGRCPADAGVRDPVGAATHADPAIRAELVAGLARASGGAGMAGGQCLDLEAEKLGRPAQPTASHVQRLQAMKTGALLRFSCEAGAILGRRRHRAASARWRATATASGSRSRSPTTCSTSKATRRPWARPSARTPPRQRCMRQATQPRAKARLAALEAEAVAALASFGAEADTLREAAGFVVRRER